MSREYDKLLPWLSSGILIPAFVGLAAGTCNVPNVGAIERQVYNGVCGFSIVAACLVTVAVIVLLVIIFDA